MGFGISTSINCFVERVEHVLDLDVNLVYGPKMVHNLHKMLISRF